MLLIVVIFVVFLNGAFSNTIRIVREVDRADDPGCLINFSEIQMHYNGTQVYPIYYASSSQAVRALNEAFDGDTSTYFLSGPAACPQSVHIDLGESVVDQVLIYNRLDCCQHRVDRCIVEYSTGSGTQVTTLPSDWMIAFVSFRPHGRSVPHPTIEPKSDVLDVVEELPVDPGAEQTELPLCVPPVTRPEDDLSPAYQPPPKEDNANETLVVPFFSSLQAFFAETRFSWVVAPVFSDPAILDFDSFISYLATLVITALTTSLVTCGWVRFLDYCQLWIFHVVRRLRLTPQVNRDLIKSVNGGLILHGIHFGNEGGELLHSATRPMIALPDESFIELSVPTARTHSMTQTFTSDADSSRYIKSYYHHDSTFSAAMSGGAATTGAGASANAKYKTEKAISGQSSDGLISKDQNSFDLTFMEVRLWNVRIVNSGVYPSGEAIVAALQIRSIPSANHFMQSFGSHHIGDAELFLGGVDILHETAVSSEKAATHASGNYKNFSSSTAVATNASVLTAAHVSFKVDKSDADETNIDSAKRTHRLRTENAKLFQSIGSSERVEESTVIKRGPASLFQPVWNILSKDASVPSVSLYYLRAAWLKSALATCVTSSNGAQFEEIQKSIIKHFNFTVFTLPGRKGGKGDVVTSFGLVATFPILAQGYDLSGVYLRKNFEGEVFSYSKAVPSAVDIVYNHKNKTWDAIATGTGKLLAFVHCSDLQISPLVCSPSWQIVSADGKRTGCRVTMEGLMSTPLRCRLRITRNVAGTSYELVRGLYMQADISGNVYTHFECHNEALLVHYNTAWYLCLHGYSYARWVDNVGHLKPWESTNGKWEWWKKTPSNVRCEAFATGTISLSGARCAENNGLFEYTRSTARNCHAYKCADVVGGTAKYAQLSSTTGKNNNSHVLVVSNKSTFDDPVEEVLLKSFCVHDQGLGFVPAARVWVPFRLSSSTHNPIINGTYLPGKVDSPDGIPIYRKVDSINVVEMRFEHHVPAPRHRSAPQISNRWVVYHAYCDLFADVLASFLSTDKCQLPFDPTLASTNDEHVWVEYVYTDWHDVRCEAHVSMV